MSELKGDKKRPISLRNGPHRISEKYHMPSVILGLCVFAAADAIAADDAPIRYENNEPETIIVTGEKVRRTIYDTGSSIEVFDGS